MLNGMMGSSEQDRGKASGDLQCSQHVSRRDAVHTDACMRPLHGQRARQMPDCRFGCVVRGLWLWDIHDHSRHAPDHHHGPFGLALHQMSGKFTGPEVGAVYVDTPEFVQTVWRISDGVEVLREAGRRDEVVDLAVVCEDLVQAGFDGL